jgi:hypothetical protein
MMSGNRRWTLSEIKAENEAAGEYFFARNTMKFFGDTMRSFSVHHEGEKVYLVRVRPMRMRCHGGGVGDRRLFDPATGHIGAILASEKQVDNCS